MVLFAGCTEVDEIIYISKKHEAEPTLFQMYRSLIQSFMIPDWNL